MVFELAGNIVLQNSLFGVGITIGLIGIVLGISRGLSKSSRTFPLILNIISWIIGVVLIPTLWPSLIMFAIGTIGIFVTFFGELEDFGESDMFKTIFVIAFLNFTVAGGLYLHDMNQSYPTSLNETDYITSRTNLMINYIDYHTNSYIIDFNDQRAEDMDPQHYITTFQQRGDEDNAQFDFMATIFAMARWATAMFKFTIIFFATPLIFFGRMLIISGRSSALAMFFGVFLNMFVLICIVQIVHFILNKRGKGNG